MSTTTIKVAIGAVAAVHSASGHGYMTTPPSRVYEAYLNNGWDSPGENEYDPHGVAAGGMYAECEDCSTRGYPGRNPWSAPGTASSASFVMAGSGKPLGVCGGAKSAPNDYNVPSPDGVWGAAASTTYRVGETISVEWCVSADHGGIPQFRLCDDADLVAKLTTAAAEPTLDDYADLEACFQRGLLRCDGAGTDDCSMVSDCDSHPDWEACAEPGKFLHCDYGTGAKCVNTGETCAHGTLARYALKIPESTKAADHSILSFRWDTYENNEVFVGCADVKIVDGGGDEEEPTPRPTAAPSVKGLVSPSPTRTVAPTPTPRPTPALTEAPPPESGGGVCCWWSPGEDMCADCQSSSAPGDWCALDEARCGECGGTWCGTMTTTAAPSPAAGESPATMAPSPAPTTATTTTCADDSSWSKKGSKSKTCAAWVAANPARRCSKKSDGGVRAEDACPLTCGACGTCVDSEAWYKEGKPRNDCDWVAKKASKRCSKKSGDGTRADSACPVACSQCGGDGGNDDVDVPAPTPRPTPRPTTEATEGDFVRHGYAENWAAIDHGAFDDTTAVFWSFLTLDPTPQWWDPEDIGWDGSAIYDSMTGLDVMEVLDNGVIDGLVTYCKNAGKKFIWALGGWSDLRRTVRDDQIESLVDKIVGLLAAKGDGIDFDFEHLSDAPKGSALFEQQRLVVGKIIVALKEKLVAEGLDSKVVVYTPRYNAFWTGGARSTFELKTDGEGIDTLTYVDARYPGAIDYVNLMMYDISALEAFKDATVAYFVQDHYDRVFDAATEYLHPSKVVFGFEPRNPQAYTGVWAGLDADKTVITHLYGLGAGGVMWWAMNDALAGENAQTEAAWVVESFA